MVGCTTTPRFTRTPLDTWKTRNFKNVGARVDLPKGVESFWIRKYPNELSISMHIVHMPGLSDDQPLVKISIRRLATAAFNAEREEFEGGLRGLENGMYVVPPKNEDERRKDERIGKALFSLQRSTARIEGRNGMVFFRRDIAFPDGHILNARLTCLCGRYPDGSDYTKEDDTAFRRILDSIEASQ